MINLSITPAKQKTPNLEILVIAFSTQTSEELHKHCLECGYVYDSNYSYKVYDNGKNNPLPKFLIPYKISSGYCPDCFETVEEKLEQKLKSYSSNSLDVVEDVVVGNSNQNLAYNNATKVDYELSPSIHFSPKLK